MNATLSETPSAPRLNGGIPGRSAPAPSADVNQQGKHLKELMERVASLPDVEARELLHECLQSVLALHGDGLARILQLVKNTGAAGLELSESMQRDKLVCSLLLIHGLHPVPLETRLRGALEKVRPYMQSHGGNVQLIHFENDAARLRLEGTCKSCPSSSVTLELAVRQAVEEACPDLLGFEVEGVVAQSSQTNHAPAEAPKWTTLEHFARLESGEMRTMEVAQVPVLFVKAGENLYAYRDYCPACKNRLDGAALESKILRCRVGHQFDVQRAGLCPDDSEIHLEPFPLLSANGVVKISVGTK